MVAETADGHRRDPPLASAAVEIRVDVEELTAFMGGAFPGGVPWTIHRLDADGVTLTLPTDDRHLRPGGTVSGPTMMMLADSAAYAVVLAAVGLEALAVTTNLSINFVRRAEPGVLVADAELLKAGRTQALAEVRLHDGDPDHLVAHAVVTYSRVLAAPGPTAT